MQIEIFGMAGIPPDVTPGSTVEQFRKAVKRQIIMGAALVDEKGNFRASAPLNATPPSLIPPPVLPPPMPRQFQTPVEPLMSQSIGSSQPGSYGGLVQGSASQQVGGGAGTTPLLYPQGSYGSNQTPVSTGQTRSLFPVISAEMTAMKTVQATPFGQTQFFPTTLSTSGNSRLRFIWNNDEMSMEELRAKNEKYSSLHNLA
eukprot:g7923.t1